MKIAGLWQVWQMARESRYIYISYAYLWSSTCQTLAICHEVVQKKFHNLYHLVASARVLASPALPTGRCQNELLAVGSLDITGLLQALHGIVEHPVLGPPHATALQQLGPIHLAALGASQG